MTYLIKHNNKEIFSLKKLVILILIFFIASFIYFDYPKKIFTITLKPVFFVGGYIYKISFGSFFSSKMALVKENDELISKLEQNKVDILDYNMLKYENKKLREDLNLKPNIKVITSSILSRPPQVPLDSLMINVGKKDLVSVGDIVLLSDHILLGKVSKVYEEFSTVILNSFGGVVSSGFIERTGEFLQISGVGGSGMKAKLPIDFDILEGDNFLIQGSVLYMIAKASVIKEDKSSGSKTVLFSLPFNISSIGTVFVVPVGIE